MRKVLLVLGLALCASLVSATGVTASSPTAMTNPDVASTIDSVAPAGYTIHWLQKVGICASTYQQAKARMSIDGGYRNYMKIIQRLQWYGSGYWHNAQAKYRDSVVFNGAGYISMAPKFYYSGATSTHTTRIRASFYWYQSGSLIASHTRYSGTCAP